MSPVEIVQTSAISPAQAVDLALLVDLEARWENLRIYQPIPAGKTSTLKDLHQRQKSYEAFSTKLAAYNKRYRPAHIPELLLNNAPRLGLWCKSMRDLYLQVQNDLPQHSTIHVLEKAYRWADRVADRMKKAPLIRSAPSGTVPGAIQELEILVQWCEGLAPIVAVEGRAIVGSGQAAGGAVCDASVLSASS